MKLRLIQFCLFLFFLGKRKGDLPYSFLTNQLIDLGQLNQLSRFVRIRSKRLFAQNMLAGLERFTGPLVMQAIRRRNVHKVHLRIVEQFLVASVGFLESVLSCRCLGGVQAAGCNCVQDHVRVCFRRMDDWEY